MAAGVCGPSFEARREERRAPQDDGGVYGWWARREERAFAHPTILLRQQRVSAVPVLRRRILLEAADPRLIEIEKQRERVRLIGAAAARDRRQCALPVAAAVTRQHFD